MKLSKYLSSKFYVIALALIVTLIEVTFFMASGNNIDTILFFTILLWVLIGCILFIDYYMKASFYKRLTETFDKLDKKYLVHEMVKEPDFLEGKILYDILQDLDKNIHDSINEYAIREKEYKEYIELWVHEVKTPLAAAKLISENNKSSEMIKIEKELERIDGFVEQALFYARSTSVEKDYVLKEYKLTDIVNPIIRKHKETFIYKKIKVELNNLDTFVYTDEKWMILLLIN
jgi:signal transduction histidine kinase